ncbi:MAG: GNAT family N-acetyltransferase [Caldilineaceae bacterium]|nr:GNAT family N-acetyltransferase [Caldilineaceae bacterium]
MSGVPADDALLAIQIDTLYRCDPDGRLRYVNESGSVATLPPAPRFFMGRTRGGNRWRFGHDLPQPVIGELEPLCQAEPVVEDFAAPPTHAAAIRRILAQHAPITDEYRGPAYWVPDIAPRPGAATLVDESNARLLETWFPSLLPLTPEHGVAAAVIVDGDAVSVCHCARLTGQAAEAGVETAPPFRGRGYAGTVVAAWAAAIRRSGRLPLYSTWWGNHASQAVARRLGMVMYAEDWSLG